MNISLNPTSISPPSLYLNYHSHLQYPILFLRKPTKKNRYGFGRSSRLMLQSAYLIASKLGVVPAPLEVILRDQFGSGSGSGSGNGNGNGFGFGWDGGFFDGGKRKRNSKFVMLGVSVLVCGVGLLWLFFGKEIVVSSDTLLAGMGLVLFGFSVDGLRRGGMDWILGFCCCGVLMSLVLKREEFGMWIKGLGFTSLKKNNRRRSRRRTKWAF